MPVPTCNIISDEELAKWPYLNGIHIPYIQANVDLLIGTNASKLMEPREVISSVGGCSKATVHRIAVDRINRLDPDCVDGSPEVKRDLMVDAGRCCS